MFLKLFFFALKAIKPNQLLREDVMVFSILSVVVFILSILKINIPVVLPVNTKIKNHHRVS
jgi:hypothetical protein